MKVYLIYGIMDQYTKEQSNTYGQYDIFNSGKVIDSLIFVLWGFTDKKEIRDQFFKERPVSNRYYEKILDMEENQYSLFMIENFSRELLPIAFDIRTNIGIRSGYFRDDYSIPRKADIAKEKRKFYRFRISTKNEYDFVANNLGEICAAYKNTFFKEHADELPLDSDIFIAPLRDFLNRHNYMADILSYHPDIVPYLNHNPDLVPKYQWWLNREANWEEQTDGNYFVDEFSILQIYYLTYKEMIFE